MDTSKAKKAAELLEQKASYIKAIEMFEIQQQKVKKIRMCDEKGSSIGCLIKDEIFVNEVTDWYLSMLKATLNHINIQIMAL